MPAHLKISISQVHLQNSIYEQILSHLEKDLELNDLEAADELQINTVTQQATQQNPEKPKSICHHSENPGHYQNQSHQLKREKDQAQNDKTTAGNNDSNNNGGQTNSLSSNEIPHNTNLNNTYNPNDRKPGPVYPPCETCGKTNHSTEKR